MPGYDCVLGVCFMDATVRGMRLGAYLSRCMGGGCVLIVCLVDATVRKKESAFRSEIGKPILFSIFPSYFASIARAEVTSGEDSEACSGVYGTLPEFPETRRRPRQSNFWCGFLT